MLDESGQIDNQHLWGAILALDPAALIMGGDTKQLGPFIAGGMHASWAMARSVFTVGIDENRFASSILQLNYRTPPHTYHPTNKVVYGGRIGSAPETECRPMFCELLAAFARITFNDEYGNDRRIPGINHFWDAEEGEMRYADDNSTSWLNEKEAEIVLGLTAALRKCGVNLSDVMALMPYNDQKNFLNEDLAHLESLRARSVDSSQRGEKGLVVYSNVTVIDVGFMANPQRINVAWSRAMEGNHCVGHRETPEDQAEWAPFLAAADEANPHYFISTKGTVTFKVDGEPISIANAHGGTKSSWEQQLAAVQQYAATSEIDGQSVRDRFGDIIRRHIRDGFPNVPAEYKGAVGNQVDILEEPLEPAEIEEPLELAEPVRILAASAEAPFHAPPEPVEAPVVSSSAPAPAPAPAPVSEALAAWQNAGSKIPADDKRQAQADHAARLEEEARNGVQTRADYTFNESFKQINLAGPSTKKVSNITFGGMDSEGSVKPAVNMPRAPTPPPPARVSVETQTDLAAPAPTVRELLNIGDEFHKLDFPVQRAALHDK